MNVYAMKDTIAGQFDRNLMTSPNDATMTRGLAQMWKGSGQFPETRPQDFALYLVGVLDQDTGELTAVEPKFICHYSLFMGGPANAEG